MQVEFENLTVETDGDVGRIILQRPHRLNALDHPLTRDLLAASRLFEEDRELRVIVFEGEGRAFCSGIDLKELSAGNIDGRFFPPWESALRRFETMDKLVLCVMHGYAIGGGLQIGLASDIRIGTPTAEYGLTAIEESILPGLGTWRLSRFIGMGRAKKMSILGNLIDGEEAHRIGLVDHLVDEDALDEEVDALIEEYKAVNSIGARLTKHAVNDSFDLPYEEFLEQYLAYQATAMDHEDFEEAMAAIREDRHPDWS